MQFILGSSSKWRRDVIAANSATKVACHLSPDIDERAVERSIPDAVPEEIALVIARAKADALAEKVQAMCADGGDGGAPKQFVLMTADQVVKHQGEARGKPETAEENCERLRSYTRDAPLSTCSAVVLTHFPSGEAVSGVDVVDVCFDGIPEEVIRAVVAKGDTLQCCGGFTIEDLHPYAVGLKEESIPSIQGMPLGLLASLYKELRAKVGSDAEGWPEEL
eukprot:Rhum_TRINITY_DN17385_c0_g2::Rhum_TRINITY_DN17385_c0_g2_i1::g.165875::m.165875/K06287/maf; septum formation protein